MKKRMYEKVIFEMFLGLNNPKNSIPNKDFFQFSIERVAYYHQHLVSVNHVPKQGATVNLERCHNLSFLRQGSETIQGYFHTVLNITNEIRYEICNIYSFFTHVQNCLAIIFVWGNFEKWKFTIKCTKISFQSLLQYHPYLFFEKIIFLYYM